jgi:hypothetical protein
VRHDAEKKHTFIYEKDDPDFASNRLVWVYEAADFGIRIRHIAFNLDKLVDSLGKFQMRRRANLGSVGIAGRDHGWIFGDFIDTFNAYGGEPNVGRPFDNGGGMLVHRWETDNPEDGYAQDFRRGKYGTLMILHGDRRPGAFLVSGNIRTMYLALSGPGGWLGWPKSQPFKSPNGCSTVNRQNFVGGYITKDCDGVFRAHTY